MTYNLFISHSWTYSDAYEKLVRLLDSKPYFVYKNYSVPKNNPIHNAHNDYQLRAAIRAQIQPASCVLILAGVYATYSKWINIEIELAKSMDKRIIAIQPWDGSMLKEIEHAINEAEIGINPTNDGKVIRLVFPELTEDRRKDLVKDIKKLGENAKVAIRNIRRDGMDHIKKKGKEDGAPEDQVADFEDSLQEATDKYVKKVDETVKAKSDEVMTV